jgi:hypothetical protein
VGDQQTLEDNRRQHKAYRMDGPSNDTHRFRPLSND